MKPSDISFTTVHEYMDQLDGFALATIRCIKGTLREIYDWLYERGYVGFTGRQMFPLIRKDPRNKLLSCYSKEEISQLLSYIDTDTESGKCVFCILSLLAYLGMRAGDVIQLRFSDIDWNQSVIHYNQQKTGNSLTLPPVGRGKVSSA